MAFNDLPQIDPSSVNDEKAKRALLNVFNQEARFIPREQTPDKGCDYKVELINESSATNIDFVIQLKSVVTPDLIKSNALISYSFETSRLNYLLNSGPIYGIIVLYDVISEILYYDDLPEIYQRLMDDRGDEEWKNQKSVNIHIPTANILDANSASHLHSVFFKRWEATKQLVNDYGKQYNLPVVNNGNTEDFNINNSEDIKILLRRIGITRFFINDLDLIFNLISKLTVKDIVADKDLLLIASLAYAEAGKSVDALFYVGRIRKLFALSAKEEHMIKYLEIRLNLNLGNITATDFVKDAKKLLPEVEDLENQITLRLNILYFELLQFRSFETMPLEYGEAIEKIAVDIDKLPENVEKYQFKIWNADNLTLWISHFRNEGFNEYSLNKALNIEIPLNERIEKAKAIHKVHQLFYMYVQEVDDYAIKNDNRLLKAYAINSLLRFQVSLSIQLVSHNSPIEDPEEKRKVLFNQINLGKTAFKIFCDYNMHLLALTMICYSMELIYLSRGWYKFQDYFDLGELTDIKKKLEREMELEPREIAIPALLNRIEHDDVENGSMRSVLKLNDDQINTLGLMVYNSGKFPNAKLENIVNEMKSFKLFFQRCNDNNIEAQVFHAPTANWTYAIPAVFVLRNKVTGITSLREHDMDKLLKSWGF